MVKGDAKMFGSLGDLLEVRNYCIDMAKMKVKNRKKCLIFSKYPSALKRCRNSDSIILMDF